MLDADALTLLAGPELDPAPWHRDRPHLLANALMTATVAAPGLDRLARLVLPRMARRVLTSSTLRTAEAASGRLLLDGAVGAQHIGIRSETHAYAVAVDCDHADWSELLEELVGHGLSRPTWIAADPWTGRAHLVWWLHDAVLLTERGREAPRRLLDAVARLLTAALRGDPAYTQGLTKNPWHRARPVTQQGAPAIPALWDVHLATAPELRHAVITAPALHSLADLRRALLAWQDATGTPTPGRRRRAIVSTDSERGRRLFDLARLRVYAAWPLDSAGVLALVDEAAAELGSPIMPRQLSGMARRMHTWCDRHLTGSSRRRADGTIIDRGRDRLETSGLDLAEKQAIAGRRTADIRRQGTAEALREAAGRLAAAGQTVTRATLAAAAGVSERTVQRVWKDAVGRGDIRCPSVVAAQAAPPAPGRAAPGISDSSSGGKQAQPSPPVHASAPSAAPTRGRGGVRGGEGETNNPVDGFAGLMARIGESLAADLADPVRRAAIERDEERARLLRVGRRPSPFSNRLW